MTRGRGITGVGVVAVAVAVAFAGARLTADQTMESVHLVVTGGAFAGTYEATSADGGCSTGANGPGTWGNALVIKGVTNPRALASLPLIVPSAKAAASGTKEFYLGVGFGPLMQRLSKPYQIEIETRVDQKKPTGSGVVTVKDNASNAVVTFSGKTADGASIDGKITCNTVLRMVP